MADRSGTQRIWCSPKNPYWMFAGTIHLTAYKSWTCLMALDIKIRRALGIVTAELWLLIIAFSLASPRCHCCLSLHTARQCNHCSSGQEVGAIISCLTLREAGQCFRRPFHCNCGWGESGLVYMSVPEWLSILL